MKHQINKQLIINIIEEGLNSNLQGKTRRNLDGANNSTSRRSSLNNQMDKHSLHGRAPVEKVNPHKGTITKALAATAGVGAITTGAVTAGKALASKADDIKASITPDLGLDEILK